MATLGAELGCERYLASTVVTGPGQRSSTFLAKLRRNGVFVLALRAFHCRPRRKKRARCTARVTSHMIGDKADARGERQPGVDAGRTPQWVGLTHATNQITDFCADLG